MAMIRQADRARADDDAIVLDLGDLMRQGDEIRRSASAQAARIINDGRDERQRIITGAREIGHAEGFADGLRAGREQGAAEGRAAALEERRTALAGIESAWREALAGFVSSRDAILLEARQDVLRLAVLFGEKVTKRRIELDESIAAAQLAATLEQITHPTRLIVGVHPEDEAVVREALPALLAQFPAARHIELALDATLPRGSCVTRTDGGGVIDASVHTQLDRLAQSLLPGRERP